MGNFSSNLKELRLEKDLSIDSLAKEIGYSRTVVYYWETGKRRPNSTALTVLSNYFGVSVDYLIGNEDVVSSIKESYESQTTLSDKEKELIRVYRSLSDNGKNTLLGSAHNIERFDPQVSAVKKA